MALIKAGEPLGLCTLDDKGFVPIDDMPAGMAYIRNEYPDIPTMLNSDPVYPGLLCFVLDATADPTVDTDWAIYKRTTYPDQTDFEQGWEKVADHESLDIAVTWEALQKILPQSSPEDIDDMVSHMHSHDNKSTLDGITESSDPDHFAYKGEEVALRKDVSHWLFGDYYEDDQIYGGDVWLRSVPGQTWWFDPSIEDAGSTCYQKYAQNSTLTVGPKVRTNNTTTFRRMFYQDYNLEQIPQYNFSQATDIAGFVQECSKLETVPYMNTVRCSIFDNAFSGCSRLKFGPEIEMGKATTAVGMYSGCPNLVMVYSFGNTKNVTSMKSMFNGDSALEKIESPIDFSSITTASDVANMFNGCIELRYLRVVPETLSVSLSLQGTNLDVDSLLSVFEGLVPYTGDLADAPTLNILDVEAASTLTSAQRALVTDIGWRLEYDVHVPVEYQIESAEELDNAINSMLAGDTLDINVELSTVGMPIVVDKEDITVNLSSDIIADGGRSSGIDVTNGELTITGNGKVVNNTPYDRNHASGIITVNAGGSLTFNGGGIDAVIEDDPVNKGQFGICTYGDGQLTINDGNFTAGWYCVSGNGSTTNADAVTTINGGNFMSTADYAIYHPHAGTLVITDGHIIGAAGALAANNGTIEISGGYLAVAGGGDTGDASDGTGGLGEALFNLNARYGDVTCTITGGTFVAPADIPLFAVGTSHNVNLQISGGKFSAKPNAAYIADGYTVTNEPDSEGYFEVIPV
jgi:hypothetical protein